MKIETERLQIRKIGEDDLQDLFMIYRNEDTCRYLLHDAWNEENKNAYFMRMLNRDTLSKDAALQLACTVHDKVIGTISATYTDMPDTVEIGYVFNSDYSKHGYASEAVKAVMDKLFNEYNVHRIIVNMDARNSDSARLCERLGMRKEAHFLKDYWNKGEWTDSFIYAILKEEWENIND